MQSTMPYVHMYIYGEHDVDDTVLMNVNEGIRWLQRSVHGKKEQFMKLVVHQQRCYMEANAQYQFIQQQSRVEVHAHMHVQVIYKDEVIKVITYPYDHKQQTMKCYALTKDEFYIGRGGRCALQYKNRFVSTIHARIWKENQFWWIENLHSTNGVYVNGEAIQKSCLYQKDFIQIMRMQMVMQEDCILVNRNDEILVHDPLKPCHIEETKTFPPLKDITITHYTIPLQYEPCTIQVDSPPPIMQQKRMPLLFVVGPALTMGLSSISMGVFSLLQMSQQNTSILQSIPTLIMAFSMGAGTLLWPLLSRRYEKRENYRLTMVREDSYHQYLHEIEARIQQELQTYQAYQNVVYHDISQCYQAILKATIVQYSQEHPAYGCVVLGVGEMPCPITFDYRRVGFAMQKDDLQRELEQLCEKAYRAQQVPIFLELSYMEVVHISGENAKQYLLQLLYQFIATHDDRAIRILCFITKEEAFTYGILWLPHGMNTYTHVQYVVSDEESYQVVCEDVYQSEENVTFYAFFFAHEYETKWRMFEKRCEKTICAWYLEEEIHCTNESKHAYIALKDTEGVLIHDFKTTPFSYTVLADFNYRYCAQIIANAKPKEKQDISIPFDVHFLDIYRCGNVKQLQIEKRWKKHDASKSLQVPIGLCISKEILYLDAHEKQDGAHGLFAGMTGSGKSECLLTYILSLATNFSPRDVSFLLIDYKGGGMAKVCAKLPHIAGIVTNLDQDMLQRSLFAIQNELVRRQQLFNEFASRYEVGNMNIDVYQRLAKEHPDMVTLSHLFIIADEFAELKVAQHEFMEELKKSARIGRSLGIHLLLATQKPAGVIDEQIWSNAHFHLCMKVQSTQDSQDMLKKDDAAYLKTTGACYLQVGLDEVYKMGQIAWSGSPYFACDEYEEEGNNEVALVTPTNTTLLTRYIHHKKNTTNKTQMEAVLEEIKRVAKHNDEKATPLWKEALSKTLYASAFDYANIMVDDMKNQQQFTITFDHTWFHHLLLYGMFSKDKEVFLGSYLYSLSARTSFVAVYVFDFDTHEQTRFKGYSHIMDIVQEHEEEKIIRFFHKMEQEIKARKKGANRYPIVWILHHYEVFHELYEALVHRFMLLLREGETYGLYIVVTTTSSTSISYRITQYIAKTIVFHMYDDHEYAQLLGTPNGIHPSSHTGSGIFQYQKEVVMFQTLCIEDSDILKLPLADTTEVDYQIPTMPKKISHNIKMYCNQLYLGKDAIEVRDQYWDLNRKGFLFLLCAYQVYKPFYKLILSSLLMSDNVYHVKKNQANHLGKRIQEEEVQIALASEKTNIFIWEELPQNTNNEIQHDVMGLNKKQHTHLVLCTMEEYMEYARYPWFQRNVAQARRCWVGKGFEEHRYALRFTSSIQAECKTNEALLWEEETCIKIQLWEEEQHG